jgi:hypothetical protein
MSQTQEIEVKELSEEQIKKLVSEILSNPHKYPTEAKFVLRLRTDFRRGGCGHLYLYSNDFEVLYGEVDKVITYRREFDCDVSEDVVIIPKTLPTIILQKHHDDNPEVNDYITLYVFTGSEWKFIEFPVPK